MYAQTPEALLERLRTQLIGGMVDQERVTQALATEIDASLESDWNAASFQVALLDAATKLATDHGLTAGLLLSDVIRLLQDSRNGPRASSRQAQILDSAYAIFARKGFHDATVEEIAALAEVGKGTIYRHFKSKDNLFRAVVEARIEELKRRIREDFAEEPELLSGIRRTILTYFHFFEEHKEFYRMLVFEQQCFGVEFRARYIGDILDGVPLLQARVLEASRDDHVKPLNDFYTVFYGIIGFVDAVIQKWFRNQCQGSLEAELDTVVEVLFYGFVNRDP